MNIKYLNVSWFRRQIAVVPQKSILFSGTINDNIAYGMVQAKYSEVIDAARRAQAHDFISDLPGVNVSWKLFSFSLSFHI